MTPLKVTRPQAVARLVVSYGAALLAGGVVFFSTPDAGPLARLLLADVVATFVVYGASVGAANTSFYDAYWSVVPPLLLMLGWALPEAAGADRTRQLLLVSALSVWGIRLTWNWARGWTGFDHEDWRYVDFRDRLPPLVFELVNLAGLHFFPTLIVFLSLTGGIFAWLAPGPAGGLAWLGASVILGGAALQFVADNALRRFRQGRTSSGEILCSGVWAWSRHPNYFGEIMVWWGVWLVGVDAGAPGWTVWGPLAMTTMFRVVSIPLIEARMARRRSGWAEHVECTRMLLPLPRLR